jgi:hypothetical protein
MVLARCHENAEANPGNKIYNRQFDQRNAHHPSSFVHIEHSYAGSQQNRTCDHQTGAYRLQDVSNALLHSYARLEFTPMEKRSW